MSKVKFLKFGIRTALFSSVILLVSCASSGNAGAGAKESLPDWVNGTPASYPPSLYISGTGSASDKKAAEIDAINELASVFGQTVSSATNASRRMEMAQSQGLVASAEASSIDQGVLREINQNDVIAVEVPEFFESKNEKKWYALAVMNKSKGSQIYSGMIEKNQGEISAIIEQVKSDKESNTMVNYARLDFAEEVARVNEGYLKRLTILNPSLSKNYASISTPVQIHKMKTDMAAKIPICVTLSEESNDFDGRIAKSFQEVMSSFGFNTTLGSNERYVINCKIHYTPSEIPDKKTHFCEYFAECALVDTFSGETLVPLSISGREGSPTYSNALVRVKQKIVSKVKNDFAVSFQKYLGDFSAL